MGKKLLSVPFIGLLFFLISWNSFGQCPTSLSISSSPGNTICEGTEVIFTANTSGGANLKFQWQINEVDVENENSATFSSTNLANNQKVRVIVTSGSEETCSKTSSAITMTVNQKRTPTVAVTGNKSSLCKGESISFTASNTNGGSSPQYNWYINGSNTVAKTGSSVTFSSSDLTDGKNNVRVVLTSSLECVTSETAEATSADFELKPDATISEPSNKDQEVCISSALSPISFTIGGGGTGATVSGLPPGISGSYNSGTYTLSGTPTTAGEFNYTVTTSGTCAQTTATGKITVDPNATISHSSGSTNQTICAAGGVASGEIEPIKYNIGQTGNDATVSGLPSGIIGAFANGIYTISGSSAVTGTHNFTVTAKGTCGDSSSLAGSITITENLAPSVSITSSDDDDEICDGDSVTFTATPTNGGSSPTYQWQINGNHVGSNSNTFTTTSLTDGQTVTVIMTSTETCRTENTATSNSITTTVNPNLTPEVSIEADNNNICPGDSVTFTATPVNEGTAPTYQWKIGNTNVGSNSSTFTTTALTDGQSVSVVLTSSETCLATATATSNSLVTTVQPPAPDTPGTISGPSEVCNGSSNTYSISAVTHADQYSWTLPDGSTEITEDPQIIFTMNRSGEVKLSVQAENTCYQSGSRELIINTVDGVPPTPGVITSSLPDDNKNICPPLSDLTFSVAEQSDADSYNWILPSPGWEILSGAGTNSITVRVTSASTNGAKEVRVESVNICGESSSSVYDEIVVDTHIIASVGEDKTVCKSQNSISISGTRKFGTANLKSDITSSGSGIFKNLPGNGYGDFTFQYEPSAADRNAGQVKITITVPQPSGGNNSGNDCGNAVDEMYINFRPDAVITPPTEINPIICINSELSPLEFILEGTISGASVTGLPAGVSGTYSEGKFVINGTPTEAGTFNYTITTSGDCNTATQSGTLTVDPRPTFDQPEAVFVCAESRTGDISFLGSSVSGTTYEWVNDNTSIGLAASGNGDISGFTATNNTTAPIIANITVTPSANNCEGTPQEFKITVYPTAIFTQPTDVEVCNSESVSEIVFSGNSVEGTTFEWTNDNPAIGLGETGIGNISSFTAENNSGESITANIKVTPIADGCEGTPQEFTIIVYPTPTFTAPEDIIACNGEDTSIHEFLGETVTGTTYSWTNDNTSIGLAASGSGDLPSFSAVNTGSEPVIAIITVIPEADTCEGTPLTFEITVNPTPEVDLPDTIILCNGEEFEGLDLSGTVAGATYSWSNNETSIGLTGSGEGNLPAFTASNTTEEPISALISVTPVANGCEGPSKDLEIIINPGTSVEAGPDQTICSNGIATMAATLGGGATEGTWTTSGSGTFNGNALNAEYSPSSTDVQNGSVTLTFTSNDPEGPCGPASDSLELTLNEEVVITTQPENIGVCSTEPSQLTVIASGDNLTYEWKRTDDASISNATGINSSTLSFNNTTSTQGGEYYVIVTGEDSCEQAISDPVTINVDENIVIEEPITEIPICGDGIQEATMKFIAHANGDPLTFKWFKDNVEVDASLDENIIIDTGEPDENGKYEGTLKIINITPAYNGDYHVEISGPEEFTCSIAMTNPFQLRVNDMPELPEVEDIVYCQGDEAQPLTVISGEDLTWYATDTGDDAFDNTPVPSTENYGETSYWVTQTPDVCESDRVEVKVIIKEKPGMPEVENVQYCLGATSQELTAVGGTGATLNWYDSEGEALSGVPTPDTETAGDLIYFVSQTPNDGFGCESDRAEITVTIFSLPDVVATIEEDTICLGTAAELTGSGAETYIWFDGETEIGTGSQFSYNPEAPGVYTITLIGIDINGCENTTEISFQIDEPTQAGTLTGPESVCVTSPGGTLTMADHLGEIQRWEKSTDGGTSWSEISETSETLAFSGLSEPTSFRAVVRNGVCEESFSDAVEIIIDPLPVGGELAFGEFGRMFVTCESPDSNSLVDLELSGHTGQIDTWEYKPASATSWQPIPEGSDNYAENSLTAVIIASLNLQETTAFRVKIISGACESFAYSQTGILSIISSNIEPTPVTVDKEVICLDESVTLSAGTGYESGEEIGESGDFDNASITNHGWRVQKDGKDEGFSTSSNNTRPDIWRRVTPREFITADINTHSTSLQMFDPGIDDGNKGFAIVSGNNASTMETSVFSITEMDQAILQFDQAYNLTSGATISVEISTNGGATYNTVLFSVTGPASSGNYSSFGSGTPASRPLNKIELDLGNYLGMGNLRIRFNYAGVRDGDVWALDGITIPDGPANIGTVWKDYSLDPENPTVIGTNTTEIWTPTLIGWNTSVIITTLEYSNGSCETAVHSEELKVFVFDTFTTSVTAVIGSCGGTSAQLSATAIGAKQGEITSYPTEDGFMGQWEVSGPEGYSFSNPEGDSGDPINNPNAIFKANDLADYTITWKLIPTEEDDNSNLIEPTCTPQYEVYELKFEHCIALDFDGEDDYVDLGKNYTSSGYSFEAWVKPSTVQGTIISGPQFNISTPSGLSTARWTHVAVAGGRLYLDGVDSGSAPTGNGGDRTLIGARWDDVEAKDFFKGWIEEVRIWNKTLTEEQIQFMMNQRLQNDANIGELIPMPAPGNLVYSDLAGYYRLISAVPDPANLITFEAGLMPANGKTPDLATNSIPGVLKNMQTNQENTAPLPYFSGTRGNWDTAGTWARGSIWALPNTNGIDWNIVRTLHDIDAGRNVTVLGLLSDENTLDIQGNNSSGWNGGGSGNGLFISHYLLLDGIIDLNGESQLVQPPGSIIDSNSSGSLHKDQQGTANSYNYNYWSSPVSQNGSNSPYTVAGVLRDGTNPATPGPVTFGDSHAFADAGKTSPIKISNYWINTFNGTADDYGSWNFRVGSNFSIKAGEGYTMKGSSGAVALTDAQNYTFIGLPHNGAIELASTTGRNYLLGNPYPSAIDAEEFIRDNLSGRRDGNYFDGTLYFWDHFGDENSHILLDYVGGYASLNLTGAVPAISNDERINANLEENNKYPGPYVPVGQGFFINTSNGEGYTVSSGEIHFRNNQREFVTEGDNRDSQFLRPEEQSNKAKKQHFEKIRLSYKSPMGYYRQILVGAHPEATDNFDLGYDAPLFDYNEEDMYWLQGNNWLVIQGVPDFAKDRTLPLGVVLKEKGEFTIKIDTLENFAELPNIYINDKLNDTVHNLTKRPFTTTSEGGYINDRFEIIFYYEEELPVDPGGDIVDAIELNVRHGHNLREIQILNPDQIPLNDLHLFDVNGNLITTYRNISHEKEVRLPVKSYSSGVYIIKLYGENTMITKKIIISN